MKKIYDAVDRFCARHPRFGITNLMRIIVAGNVLVYILQIFTQVNDASALDFLAFNWTAICHGEIWRIVTYIFVPNYGGPFFTLIALYFYYWIGSTLERHWGTAKFNLYFISGVLLTAIGGAVAAMLMHQNVIFAGATYVNLSMFFAFAVLFGETRVLLMFIIPVKMKWLAIADGVFFAYEILTSLADRNWGGALLPVIALLNFAVFIWPEVHYFAEREKYQHSRRTVQFKKAVQQQQQQRGYHHKCAVCGRTDTDYPDLQFRYCSKCAGYHCYCQDHIFSHVHFTEE